MYLAEVKIQKGGVFGGSKAQLKLLACQRGEQSWTAVPGEEVIDADEAGKFENGMLVLVDLSANKQVQRQPQEAARQLVSILQNFSRLQDKFKTQEEEIEQWKQSLTYQSQELNRREMELQAQEEEIGQMQGEFERLEQTRQEIDSARDQANQLQAELEQKRQELENSWQQLNGERQRLNEQLQENSGRSLDEEQSRYIQELIEHLSGAIPPTTAVREQLNRGLEMLSLSQSVLDQHWQNLESFRGQAQQLQSEVDRHLSEFNDRERDCNSVRASLDQARMALKVQENTMRLKEDYAQALGLRLQTQEELHSTIYKFVDTSDKVSISPKVDVEALERMALDELQGLVQQLQQTLEKDIPFVNDQQDELRSSRETIDELQVKLGRVSDYERRSVEEELADEQDRYEMLNKTVEGQLRIIRERKEILAQHEGVLSRRLGRPMSSLSDSQLDFAPILNVVEAQRQQMAEELQGLEREIEQMRQSIQQAQGMIEHQAGDTSRQEAELRQLEEALVSRRTAAAQMWGKVGLYEEMLQPVQERLNEVRSSLEGAAGNLNHVQEMGDYQLQLIAQLRQFMQGLMGEVS
nr:pilus motility taxis protein HmpF [Ancylothrix sp. D3o]